MSDEAFEELLAVYFEGNISEQELRQLHSLVHSTERLRIRFQDEVRLHTMLRENLSEQVELQEIVKSTQPIPQFWLRHSTVVTIAASTLILISSMAIYAVFFASNHHDSPLATCMGITGTGNLLIERGTHRLQATADSTLEIGDLLTCDDATQAMLRLADGSILAMEPRSSLQLVSEQPIVRLRQGEVFFEIAKRKTDAQAFQVVTKESTVDVMGTVFSVSDKGHTELIVYEGSVILTRLRDSARVEVKSQEMASTATKQLVTQNLSQQTSTRIKVVNLTPTDDLTLVNGSPDSSRLKVEGKRRIAYLRFEIPKFGIVRSAILRLKQDVDTGEGTLRFYVGNHSDWTEANLHQVETPQPLQVVAKHKGVVRRGQIVEVDVTDAIKQPGPLTLIVMLDKTGENDIWFASRESDFPPQLILSTIP